MRKKILTVIALLCLTACYSSRAVLIKSNSRTPAKRFDSYSFEPAAPIASRVKPAPSFLLDYLRNMDRNETYGSYLPTDKEMAMVGEYIEKLPALHKAVLRDRLIGIYFVEHFQGAGLADYVLDLNNKLYVILVFNPEILNHTMSQWMSYRENSVFKKDSDTIGIEVNCGTAYSGLMYGLLHESSHAVDYVLNFTPYTEHEIKVLRDKQAPQTTPFVKEAWLDHSKLAPGYDFPRDKVSLYGNMNGPHLSLKEALPLYKNLSNSPFTSLCSLMNWAEDFAEYVTWYHFTQALGQPYTITVRDNGATIFSLTPMESEIVKKREHAIRQIYADSETQH